MRELQRKKPLTTKKRMLFIFKSLTSVCYSYEDKRTQRYRGYNIPLNPITRTIKAKKYMHLRVRLH